MSLHLPADQVDLEGEVSDGSASSSSSDAGGEETWSDWVSDSMGDQPCKSLFDDSKLPSVSAANQYDLENHNFNLNETVGRLGASARPGKARATAKFCEQDWTFTDGRA